MYVDKYIYSLFSGMIGENTEVETETKTEAESEGFNRPSTSVSNNNNNKANSNTGFDYNRSFRNVEASESFNPILSP